MARAETSGMAIAGVATCTPARRFDNLEETRAFPADEVKKVVAMAGVRRRPLAGEALCASDLCTAAARRLLDRLDWDPASIELLLMITQTPDYFLPQTACVVHRALGLGDGCATMDIGLGCSGYPYGLWLAASLARTGGLRRVLLLHGDTPSRYSHSADRSVSLLFGDAGSATALEAGGGTGWRFRLHTDSGGLEDMIIPGGGFRRRFPEDPESCFVRMNGANVFHFTIKRVPELVAATLTDGGIGAEGVDYFILHQSNRFIMMHLGKKIGIPEAKMPIILEEFGNTGGCSIPLTLTQAGLRRPADRPLSLMLIGYGVGLSWASALVDLPAAAVLDHTEIAPEGGEGP